MDSVNNSVFVRVITGYVEEPNSSIHYDGGVGDDTEAFALESTDVSTVIYLTIMFFVVGVVGMMGNLLVIIAVVCSPKMRKSMTNLLITNLAFADLLIMALGVPEIIQFMMNRGWTFSALTCRINRFVLVSCLYGSVLTLISLCVERYV